MSDANDRQETIADIADEIKRAVESMGDEIPYTTSVGTMRRVADRIKEAAKRERAEIETDALAVGGIVEAARHKPGDAEAHTMTLDEAIAHAEDVADRCDTSCGREHRQLADWLKELLDVKSQHVGNAAEMREALEFVEHMNDSPYTTYDVLVAIQKARSALSAPARNCDLKECSSDDGMISAHERFCESWHDDGKSCAVCPHNPKSYLMTCREKWLLAPAAERKGEGDENK